MSYCKYESKETSPVNCLACPRCLPPSKRINGQMCADEVMDDEERED